MPATKKRTAKKLDPKQLFTIMTVSRESIAECLNCALDETDGSKDEIVHFTEDDPRLTDKVCQDIADTLYDALTQCEDDTSASAESEVYANALERWA